MTDYITRWYKNYNKANRKTNSELVVAGFYASILAILIGAGILIITTLCHNGSFASNVIASVLLVLGVLIGAVEAGIFNIDQAFKDVFHAGDEKFTRLANTNPPFSLDKKMNAYTNALYMILNTLTEKDPDIQIISIESVPHDLGQSIYITVDAYSPKLNERYKPTIKMTKNEGKATPVQTKIVIKGINNINDEPKEKNQPSTDKSTENTADKED